MERRLIFPLLMFVIAGCSFGYGLWEHMHAQAIAQSSDARLAHVVAAVEQSSLESSGKQKLYLAMFEGLPAMPSGLGIDVSGSFASNPVSDACQSDGQRAICRALRGASSPETTYQAVCGACDPLIK